MMDIQTRKSKEKMLKKRYIILFKQQKILYNIAVILPASHIGEK